MNKADRKKLLSEITALRQAGDAMSNICFNLAQDDKQTAHLRKTFDQCRKDWDTALRQLDTAKL